MPSTTTTRPAAPSPALSSRDVEPDALSADDDGYTLRRFLRELAVALTIVAVGLPVVLLTTGGSPSLPGAALGGGPVLVVSGGALPGQELLDGLEAPGQAVVEPGAGWTTASPSLTSLLAEGDHDPEQALVVVQGGEADLGADPARVELLAMQLADRVRAGFRPSTGLVFVGPVPGPEGATPELLAVRDALRRAAAEKDVELVDPVEQGWTTADEDLAVELAAQVAAANSE